MQTNSMLQKMISRYGCNRFDEVVAWYMDNGYVYIGPDAVILAQVCSKSSLLNEQKGLDRDDCWYVQYAAGQISRIFDMCPEPLEWVVFERWGNNKRKAYKFNRLERYFNGRTRYSTTESNSTSCEEGSCNTSNGS